MDVSKDGGFPQQTHGKTPTKNGSALGVEIGGTPIFGNTHISPEKKNIKQLQGGESPGSFKGRPIIGTSGFPWRVPETVVSTVPRGDLFGNLGCLFLFGLSWFAIFWCRKLLYGSLFCCGLQELFRLVVFSLVFFLVFWKSHWFHCCKLVVSWVQPRQK